MKTKLFLIAAVLVGSFAFANVPAGKTCTLDAEGTKECFRYEDSNGNTTGYSCDTAESNPNNNKCK